MNLLNGMVMVTTETRNWFILSNESLTKYFYQMNTKKILKKPNFIESQIKYLIKKSILTFEPKYFFVVVIKLTFDSFFFLDTKPGAGKKTHSNVLRQIF